MNSGSVENVTNDLIKDLLSNLKDNSMGIDISTLKNVGEKFINRGYSTRSKTVPNTGEENKIEESSTNEYENIAKNEEKGVDIYKKQNETEECNIAINEVENEPKEINTDINKNKEISIGDNNNTEELSVDNIKENKTGQKSIDDNKKKNIPEEKSDCVKEENIVKGRRIDISKKKDTIMKHNDEKIMNYKTEKKKETIANVHKKQIKKELKVTNVNARKSIKNKKNKKLNVVIGRRRRYSDSDDADYVISSRKCRNSVTEGTNTVYHTRSSDTSQKQVEILKPVMQESCVTVISRKTYKYNEKSDACVLNVGAKNVESSVARDHRASVYDFTDELHHCDNMNDESFNLPLQSRLRSKFRTRNTSECSNISNTEHDKTNILKNETQLCHVSKVTKDSRNNPVRIRIKKPTTSIKLIKNSFSRLNLRSRAVVNTSNANNTRKASQRSAQRSKKANVQPRRVNTRCKQKPYVTVSSSNKELNANEENTVESINPIKNMPARFLTTDMEYYSLTGRCKVIKDENKEKEEKPVIFETPSFYLVKKKRRKKEKKEKKNEASKPIIIKDEIIDKNQDETNYSNEGIIEANSNNLQTFNEKDGKYSFKSGVPFGNKTPIILRINTHKRISDVNGSNVCTKKINDKKIQNDTCKFSIIKRIIHGCNNQNKSETDVLKFNFYGQTRESNPMRHKYIETENKPSLQTSNPFKYIEDKLDSKDEVNLECFTSKDNLKLKLNIPMKSKEESYDKDEQNRGKCNKILSVELKCEEKNEKPNKAELLNINDEIIDAIPNNLNMMNNFDKNENELEISDSSQDEKKSKYGVQIISVLDRFETKLENRFIESATIDNKITDSESNLVESQLKDLKSNQFEANPIYVNNDNVSYCSIESSTRKVSQINSVPIRIVTKKRKLNKSRKCNLKLKKGNDLRELVAQNEDIDNSVHNLDIRINNNHETIWNKHPIIIKRNPVHLKKPDSVFLRKCKVTENKNSVFDRKQSHVIQMNHIESLQSQKRSIQPVYIKKCINPRRCIKKETIDFAKQYIELLCGKTRGSNLVCKNRQADDIDDVNDDIVSLASNIRRESNSRLITCTDDVKGYADSSRCMNCKFALRCINHNNPNDEDINEGFNDFVSRNREMPDIDCVNGYAEWSTKSFQDTNCKYILRCINCGGDNEVDRKSTNLNLTSGNGRITDIIHVNGIVVLCVEQLQYTNCKYTLQPVDHDDIINKMFKGSNLISENIESDGNNDESYHAVLRADSYHVKYKYIVRCVTHANLNDKIFIDSNLIPGNTKIDIDNLNGETISSTESFQSMTFNSIPRCNNLDDPNAENNIDASDKGISNITFGDSVSQMSCVDDVKCYTVTCAESSEDMNCECSAQSENRVSNETDKYNIQKLSDSDSRQIFRIDNEKCELMPESSQSDEFDNVSDRNITNVINEDDVPDIKFRNRDSVQIPCVDDVKGKKKPSEQSFQNMNYKYSPRSNDLSDRNVNEDMSTFSDSDLKQIPRTDDINSDMVPCTDSCGYANCKFILRCINHNNGNDEDIFDKKLNDFFSRYKEIPGIDRVKGYTIWCPKSSQSLNCKYIYSCVNHSVNNENFSNSNICGTSEVSGIGDANGIMVWCANHSQYINCKYAIQYINHDGSDETFDSNVNSENREMAGINDGNFDKTSNAESSQYMKYKYILRCITHADDNDKNIINQIRSYSDLIYRNKEISDIDDVNDNTILHAGSSQDMNSKYSAHYNNCIDPSNINPTDIGNKKPECNLVSDSNLRHVDCTDYVKDNMESYIESSQYMNYKPVVERVSDRDINDKDNKRFGDLNDHDNNSKAFSDIKIEGNSKTFSDIKNEGNDITFGSSDLISGNKRMIRIDNKHDNHSDDSVFKQHECNNIIFCDSNVKSLNRKIDAIDDIKENSILLAERSQNTNCKISSNCHKCDDFNDKIIIDSRAKGDEIDIENIPDSNLNLGNRQVIVINDLKCGMVSSVGRSQNINFKFSTQNQENFIHEKIRNEINKDEFDINQISDSSLVSGKIQRTSINNVEDTVSVVGSRKIVNYIQYTDESGDLQIDRIDDTISYEESCENINCDTDNIDDRNDVDKNFESGINKIRNSNFIIGDSQLSDIENRKPDTSCEEDMNSDENVHVIVNKNNNMKLNSDLICNYVTEANSKSGQNSDNFISDKDETADRQNIDLICNTKKDRTLSLTINEAKFFPRVTCCIDLTDDFHISVLEIDVTNNVTVSDMVIDLTNTADSDTELEQPEIFIKGYIQTEAEKKVNKAEKKLPKAVVIKLLNEEKFLYEPRNATREADERKRKRWDIQRIRELRNIELLKEKMENRKNKWGRTNRKKKEEKCAKQLLPSFMHSVDELKYVKITKRLPICVFGANHHLVIPESRERFRLPWRSKNRIKSQDQTAENTSENASENTCKIASENTSENRVNPIKIIRMRRPVKKLGSQDIASTEKTYFMLKNDKDNSNLVDNSTTAKYMVQKGNSNRNVRKQSLRKNVIQRVSQENINKPRLKTQQKHRNKKQVNSRNDNSTTVSSGWLPEHETHDTLKRSRSSIKNKQASPRKRDHKITNLNKHSELTSLLFDDDIEPVKGFQVSSDVDGIVNKYIKHRELVKLMVSSSSYLQNSKSDNIQNEQPSIENNTVFGDLEFGSKNDDTQINILPNEEIISKQNGDISKKNAYVTKDIRMYFSPNNKKFQDSSFDYQKVLELPLKRKKIQENDSEGTKLQSNENFGSKKYENVVGESCSVTDIESQLFSSDQGASNSNDVDLSENLVFHADNEISSDILNSERKNSGFDHETNDIYTDKPSNKTVSEGLQSSTNVDVSEYLMNGPNNVQRELDKNLYESTKNKFNAQTSSYGTQLEHDDNCIFIEDENLKILQVPDLANNEEIDSSQKNNNEPLNKISSEEQNKKIDSNEMKDSSVQDLTEQLTYEGCLEIPMSSIVEYCSNLDKCNNMDIPTLNKERRKKDYSYAQCNPENDSSQNHPTKELETETKENLDFNMIENKKHQLQEEDPNKYNKHSESSSVEDTKIHAKTKQDTLTRYITRNLEKKLSNNSSNDSDRTSLDKGVKITSSLGQAQIKISSHVKINSTFEQDHTNINSMIENEHIKVNSSLEHGKYMTRKMVACEDSSKTNFTTSALHANKEVDYSTEHRKSSDNLNRYITRNLEKKLSEHQDISASKKEFHETEEIRKIGIIEDKLDRRRNSNSLEHVKQESGENEISNKDLRTQSDDDVVPATEKKSNKSIHVLSDERVQADIPNRYELRDKSADHSKSDDKKCHSKCVKGIVSCLVNSEILQSSNSNVLVPVINTRDNLKSKASEITTVSHESELDDKLGVKLETLQMVGNELEMDVSTSKAHTKTNVDRNFKMARKENISNKRIEISKDQDKIHLTDYCNKGAELPIKVRNTDNRYITRNVEKITGNAQIDDHSIQGSGIANKEQSSDSSNVSSERNSQKTKDQITTKATECSNKYITRNILKEQKSEVLDSSNKVECEVGYASLESKPHDTNEKQIYSHASRRQKLHGLTETVNKYNMRHLSKETKMPKSPNTVEDMHHETDVKFPYPLRDRKCDSSTNNSQSHFKRRKSNDSSKALVDSEDELIKIYDPESKNSTDNSKTRNFHNVKDIKTSISKEKISKSTLEKNIDGPGEHITSNLENDQKCYQTISKERHLVSLEQSSNEPKGIGNSQKNMRGLMKEIRSLGEFKIFDECLDETSSKYATRLKEKKSNDEECKKQSYEKKPVKRALSTDKLVNCPIEIKKQRRNEDWLGDSKSNCIIQIRKLRRNEGQYDDFEGMPNLNSINEISRHHRTDDNSNDSKTKPNLNCPNESKKLRTNECRSDDSKSTHNSNNEISRHRKNDDSPNDSKTKPNLNCPNESKKLRKNEGQSDDSKSTPNSNNEISRHRKNDDSSNDSKTKPNLNCPNEIKKLCKNEGQFDDSKSMPNSNSINEIGKYRKNDNSNDSKTKPNLKCPHESKKLRKNEGLSIDSKGMPNSINETNRHRRNDDMPDDSKTKPNLNHPFENKKLRKNEGKSEDSKSTPNSINEISRHRKNNDNSNDSKSKSNLNYLIKNKKMRKSDGRSDDSKGTPNSITEISRHRRNDDTSNNSKTKPNIKYHSKKLCRNEVRPGNSKTTPNSSTNRSKKRRRFESDDSKTTPNSDCKHEKKKRRRNEEKSNDSKHKFSSSHSCKTYVTRTGLKTAEKKLRGRPKKDVKEKKKR